MKKNIRFMSLILVLTLVTSIFGGTAAFAADTQATQITVSDNFDTLETVQLNSMYYLVVEVNKPELTLTALSSDASVLKIEQKKLTEKPGTFHFDLSACKNGEATVTFTASDGTIVSRKLTVEGTGEPGYTISSDTNNNFSLSKGSSSIIKIHFENNDINTFTSPYLISSDEKTLKITMVNFDEANNDYYYRVDAVGSAGQTDDLYMGAYGFIPKKLCTAAIIVNKDLRLDTDSEYTCNVDDTYRFVAYTGSATAPVVSTNNNLTSVTYIGKVSGGYEYEMKALETGNSLVMVQLNGETASFPVSVNQEYEFPNVTPDTANDITLAQGESYTYKLKIMGGGEPKFVAGTDGVLSVQMVKKDGINYDCKVTAVGKPKDQTGLYVTFPNSWYNDYSVDLGCITIKESSVSPTIAPKSDTNNDFSIKHGASYTFKITGAASFHAGTEGVFKTDLIEKIGNDSYYKITAIGQPGQATGLYMAAAGQPAQKVCVVTVGASLPAEAPKSDTNNDFSIKQGASYSFKITGAASFHAGTDGVFKTDLIEKIGNDAYYKITAIGQSGQSTGFYMAAAGQPAQKVCVVTVGAAAEPIAIQSDTNMDFGIAQQASYQFKITARGAKSINFNAGTAGVFEVAFVSHTGDDFIYKITAIGKPGQEAGIYASVPGQNAKKLCKVIIAQG